MSIKLKPLNQDEFSMKIIEDLGMLYKTKNSIEKKRFAIFECNNCKAHFKFNALSVKYNKRKYCQSCSHKTHGHTNTRIYLIWKSMKRRCNDENHTAFKSYGGRGISICNEWNSNFISFYNWSIKNGYKNELTIDRIENDGNYEPSNCRWVDRHMQQANRRISNKNTSGYIGVSFNKEKNKYVSKIAINKKAIHIGYYITAKEAAIARDQYIIDNKLFEYALNNVL